MNKDLTATFRLVVCVSAMVLVAMWAMRDREPRFRVGVKEVGIWNGSDWEVIWPCDANAPILEKELLFDVVSMNVSAYCPCEECCGEFADGITASSYEICYGNRFVAAPKTYPFGTIMIVPGYNDGEPVYVRDRGGAIKGNKLDLYFDTHDEALEWGRQWIDVKVMR